MAKQVNVAIGGYQFACYPLSEAGVVNGAAVYVVLCVSEGGSWQVLDVGQSGDAGQRITSHPRRECWLANCANRNIWVCIYPMPSSRFTKENRLGLEQHLRRQYSPPCGDR